MKYHCCCARFGRLHTLRWFIAEHYHTSIVTAPRHSGYRWCGIIIVISTPQSRPAANITREVTTLSLLVIVINEMRFGDGDVISHWFGIVTRCRYARCRYHHTVNGH